MALNDLETQLDKLRASAADIQQKLRNTRERIDADDTLSLTGKNQAKTEATDKARAELTQLREREKQLVNDRIDSINRTLGGYTGSDPTALIAFRDAYDRAESLDQRKAMTVLDRARTMGDKVLAAAIMRTALARGWNDVYRAYIDAYPDAREHVEDLRTLQGFLTNSFQRTAAYAAIG